ncbi:unnamed protein product [Arabidopsis thaliana]|uniref:Arginyl-tRNA synthetase catalytic core domain-containing protein n=1 Tax=Arabidopsis thaliana TaxID=3702 RepID=A0A654GC07_ARATH|nr:unnamed protein product [Arabidopsis thaliana]
MNEAKNPSKDVLIERGKHEEWTPKELDQTGEAVRYAAVKYADLMNNRLTDYTFNVDHLLNDETGMLVLNHADERVLGLHFTCYDLHDRSVVNSVFLFDEKNLYD